MHGHVRAEMFNHPLRHFLHFFFRIVQSRDEQGGQFQPHVGFVLDVLQGVQYRLQVRAGDLPVEIVSEGLQVDIGRVHVLIEFTARFVAHVAGRDRHRLDVVRAARLGHVDGVLHEHHRVVVGVGHALAAERFRGARDGLRAGLVHERVHLPRFGDVPVLAEFAGQVAAGGAERQDRRAGQEVVERFLFDRVHAVAAGAAPGGQDDLVILVGAHEAQAALPLTQLAVAWADIALHAPVFQLVPVAGRVRGVEDFLLIHGTIYVPKGHKMQ